MCVSKRVEKRVERESTERRSVFGCMAFSIYVLGIQCLIEWPSVFSDVQSFPCVRSVF